jgi:hypothetical protein
LQIEVTQIIIHKTDQPEVLVNFFDAHGWTGEHRAEINFFVSQTNESAIGDDNVVRHGEAAAIIMSASRTKHVTRGCRPLQRWASLVSTASAEYGILMRYITYLRLNNTAKVRYAADLPDLLSTIFSWPSSFSFSDTLAHSVLLL